MATIFVCLDHTVVSFYIFQAEPTMIEKAGIIDFKASGFLNLNAIFPLDPAPILYIQTHRAQPPQDDQPLSSVY